MTHPLRIVKVGGSLFDLEDLPKRLLQWLTRQESAATVLLAGGGELTETMRKADRRFKVGESASHDLCVALLDVSARLLTEILPGMESTDDWTRLQTLSSLTEATAMVFSPTRFLRDIEPTSPGDPLPHAWDVTTDSIAARIAELLGADELVLLKSTLPGEFLDLPQLADRGYVDAYFPWAAKPLDEVRFVDLRSDNFPEVYAFE